MKNTIRKNRILWLDFLRIFAACCVVLVHIPIWSKGDFFVGNSPVRLLASMGVPLFLMISGVFLLSPHKDMSSTHIQKAVIRFIKIFLVWSACFVVLSLIKDIFVKHTLFSWLVYLKEFIKGYYHLWYLQMLVVLYITLPFLRLISSSKQAKNLIGYVLVLSFCTSLVFALANLFPEIMKTFYYFLPYPVMGFCLYLVGGYYLYNYKLPKVLCWVLYISSVCILLFLIYSEPLVSRPIFSYYFTPLTPWCFVLSSTLFLIGKRLFQPISFSEKTAQKIDYLSQCTLGVYLIHPIIINLLGLLSCNICASPGVFYVIVLITSFGITGILYRIPFLRKILF